MKDKHKLKNSRTKKYRIIILGLIVHTLLMFAVFDIYFSTPLDHGMKLVRSTTSPPAKRLVIFVADGLRAEAVLGKNMNRIPFLKTIAQNQGSWGVAHTRVPTESRPGHVALLAGIYEDPSAIMKGWKANPVEFDSVINQSSNAWCWGSPDILNVFNKDNLSHIHLHTYSAELEDFGEDDTGLLDMWVFDKVEQFLLKDVKNCINIDCDKYGASGTVFLLHLLGIDTAGHGFKPHSKEYINNIKLVDRNVEKISELFSSTFQDGLTSFVFTADHGMTDWGSHGAGSPHETEAPLIAWGAGVKKDPKRHDVKQIDITPFLAGLIGINIPSNSLGVVPLNYLEMSKKKLAELQLSNTLQLLEIFNIKRLRTEANAFVFIPYKGLTTEILTETVDNLKTLQHNEDYSFLINECEKFMKVLINGLDYYHNYYQYPLLISVSLGFIGWIFFLVTSILDDQNKLPEDRSSKLDKNILVILNIIPVLLCYLQRFPLSFYLHFTFPFAVITFLYDDLSKLSSIFAKFGRNINHHKINILVFIISIELLVYGFFNRAAFTVLSVMVGLWIFYSDSFGKYSNRRDKILWVSLCIILSIFPLFPVMKTSFNMPMYVLGFITWIVLFYEMYCRLKFQHQFRNVAIHYQTFYFQFLCLILAGTYGICLETGWIRNNSPLKYFSWCLLTMPISLIPFTSKFVAVRLIATFFGFAPFYLLVSSNFEAVFSAIYVAILCNWLLIESKTFQAADSSNLIYYVNFDSYQSKEKINSDMFRRSFLFMVFIFIGFFGTGNIASLNSFDPMWVRAFLTVFSPFKMMGLILLKIMVPFLFTCCVFRAINAIGKENILQMFCVILIFSDLMVLQFLYLITNKGSWLDIGTSLSHFLIMEAFVTILLVLYGFAHVITTVSFLKLVK